MSTRLSRLGTPHSRMHLSRIISTDTSRAFSDTSQPSRALRYTDHTAAMWAQFRSGGPYALERAPLTIRPASCSTDSRITPPTRSADRESKPTACAPPSAAIAACVGARSWQLRARLAAMRADPHHAAIPALEHPDERIGQTPGAPALQH